MNTYAYIVFGAFDIFRVGAGTAAVVRVTAGVPAVVRVPVVGGVAEDVKQARHGAVVWAVAPLVRDEVAHVVSLSGAPGLPIRIIHQCALFISNILELKMYFSFCYHENKICWIYFYIVSKREDTGGACPRAPRGHTW